VTIEDTLFGNPRDFKRLHVTAFPTEDAHDPSFAQRYTIKSDREYEVGFATKTQCAGKN